MRLTLHHLAPGAAPGAPPRPLQFATDQLVVLGRAAGSTVVLEREGVSRQHALMRFGNPPPGRAGRRAWWLTDLGSTHGTRASGRDVGQGWELRAGDVVEVGGARLRVELERIRADRLDPVDECTTCPRRLAPGEGLRQGEVRVCPVCLNGAGQVEIEGYRLITELGVGSYGKVWLASDGERLAAVKTTVGDPDFSEEDHREARRRFEREARVLEVLQHPYLVRVYGTGQYPDGQWLAMELLRTDLHRLVQDQGPLRPARAIELTRAVAEGVSFVHEQGILHRDLKPGNVLLDCVGELRLGDFGLCLGTNDTRLTRPGLGMGTLYYTAPEQLRDTRAASARSDVYGVGAILYYLLSGSHPFAHLKGSFSEVLRDMLRLPLPPVHTLVPSLPIELSRVVQRAMHRQPEERYPGCGALLEALDALPPQ